MKNKVPLVFAALAIGLLGGYFIRGNVPKAPRLPAAFDSSAVRWPPEFNVVEIASPLDKKIQKAYFYSSTSSEPQPLIVNLHSWSWDYRQFDTLAILSKSKNVHYIHPDFRGQNWTKNACCSDYVISDIDASIDYAIAHAAVDTARIYVIGRSGGGYATIGTFMKSKHRIKKFSAWVPLTDLLQWYDETRIRKFYYADNILVCTSSLNGILNKEMAKKKSPRYWPTPVEKFSYTKLEIFTGVYDGLTNDSPIPITQSINFYNKVLQDLHVSDSSRYVSDKEKLKLLEFRKPLADYGKIGNRKVCLMKEYGGIKIIIFAGGHELLPEFAFDDLLK